MISTTNLIIILVVVILLFGAKRIPEIAKGLGRAMFEFKKAKHDLEREAEGLAAAAEDKAKKQARDESEKPDAG